MRYNKWMKGFSLVEILVSICAENHLTMGQLNKFIDILADAVSCNPEVACKLKNELFEVLSRFLCVSARVNQPSL